MAATYIPISSLTLNTSASSFGFANIPGTYRDIVVKISARANSGGNTHENFYFTVNGNRSSLWLKSFYGVGDIGQGGQASNGNASYQGAFPGSGNLANLYGNSEWTFGRYSSGLYATLLVDVTSESNGNNGQNYAGGMLWEDQNAITDIVWYNYNGGDFAAGTTADLYGIAY